MKPGMPGLTIFYTRNTMIPTDWRYDIVCQAQNSYNYSTYCNNTRCKLWSDDDTRKPSLELGQENQVLNESNKWDTFMIFRLVWLIIPV